MWAVMDYNTMVDNTSRAWSEWGAARSMIGSDDRGENWMILTHTTETSVTHLWVVHWKRVLERVCHGHQGVEDLRRPGCATVHDKERWHGEAEVCVEHVLMCGLRLFPVRSRSIVSFWWWCAGDALLRCLATERGDRMTKNGGRIWFSRVKLYRAYRRIFERSGPLSCTCTANTCLFRRVY